MHWNLWKNSIGRICGLACALSFLALSAVTAQASQLAIPRIFQGVPANNLSVGGTLISPSEALQRRLQKEDISKLDPHFVQGIDPLWSPKKLSASNADQLGYPQGAPVVDFRAFSSGDGPGLFRAQVENQGKAYRLAISRTAHTALAQAALLRKLGYKVDSPKWYANLTVVFKDIASRNDFLDRVGAGTMVDPDPVEKDKRRWVVEKPENEPKLVLQDVLLETINVKSPPLHWSMMTARAIGGRREFRGLATPFAFLDIGESVNLFDWRTGRIESENWIVKFPVAEQFQEVTVDDIRWSARKILQLSDQDLREVIAAGQWPKAYEALLVEVTKARRNDLISKLRFENESSVATAMPFNFGVTYQGNSARDGEVVNGKATQERVAGYAERFSLGDADPILPPDEKRRFLLAEGIEYGMGQAFSKLNSRLQLSSASDVFSKHMGDLNKKIFNLQNDNFTRMQNGLPPKSLEFPAYAFIGPTAGVDLDASRSVNIGTYFGSDFPVQMVDRLTVGAHAGVIAGVSLNEFTKPAPIIPLQPTIEAELKVQRSYIRVRPITKVKEALEHNWGELFVPGFLGSLAKVLETGTPRTKETAKEATEVTTPTTPTPAPTKPGPLGLLGVGDAQYPTVQWPTFLAEVPGAAAGEAFDLIQDVGLLGLPSKADVETADGAGKVSDDTKASDEMTDAKKLEAFLKELRTGEIFHIVDTVSTGVGAGLTIPLTVLIGAVPFGDPVSIGLGISSSVVVTRRTTFERKEDGVHVYIQQGNTKGISGNISLSAIVKIFNYSRGTKSGRSDDRGYLLNTYETTQAGETDAQKKTREKNTTKLVLALGEILRHNNISVLEENFEPYMLAHQWRARFEREQFLIWQKSQYEEDHFLSVTPPKDREKPEYNPSNDTRTFFSSRVTRRKGVNWFSFLKDAVPSLLKETGIARVGSSGSSDPASEFMGSSTSSTVKTEGEVTQGIPDPDVILPMTMVEQHSTGWQMSRADAIAVLEKFERQFNGSKIRKTRLFSNEHLGTMNDIQLFDLSATLIIYGEGMKRLMNLVGYADGTFESGARRTFTVDDWNNLDGVDAVLSGNTNVCRIQGPSPGGNVMVYGPEWAFRNMQWLLGPEKWNRWEQTEGREWTTSSSPGMMNRFRYTEKKRNPWYFQRGCLKKIVYKFCSEGRENEANQLQAAIEGVDAGTYASVSKKFGSYCSSSGFPHTNFIIDKAPDWMRKIMALREPMNLQPSQAVAVTEIKRINQRIDLLLANIEWDKLIQVLGDENIFFQMRMTGFRQNQESGDVKDAEFLSDSIGLFDSRAAAGPIRKLISDTGISAWELNGTSFSEGE